jgi:O-antigen ligase
MNKLIVWWGWGVYVFLCISIILLGVGGGEPFPGVGISAWSISRTTFFFWLIWKVIVWCDRERPRPPLEKQIVPIPLLIFFIVVTVSLLPDFHNAGDYPYLLFACAHAVMLIDVFGEYKKARLLYLGLALLPLMLVVRGLVDDPTVFNFSLTRRFDYPLDHANTAGYLFAMSIPLALSVALTEKGLLRGLGFFSAAIQALGLVLTYSRGAWVGWAAGMLFMTFSLKKWTVGVLMILLPAILVVSIAPLRERVATLVHPREDFAIDYRLRLMTDALRLGLENPVFGIGYGRGRLKAALRLTYKGTVYEGLPIWHAHNVYAGLFAETGLVGLGAFLGLLGQTFIIAWRRKQSEDTKNSLVALGLAAAWVAAAMSALGDVPFYHHSTRIFFFSLFALIQLYGQGCLTGNHAGNVDRRRASSFHTEGANAG